MAKREFLIYHPYLTFSDPLNTRFVTPDGKRECEINAETEALFRIGRDAYKRLPHTKSKEDFDNEFSGYFKSINDFRLAFQEWDCKCRDSSGNVLNVDWGNVEDHQIVDVAWQMFSEFQTIAGAGMKKAFTNLNLCHALFEIDNAIILIYTNSTDAVSASVSAGNALANAIAIDSGNEKAREARKNMARKGAIARIERDPRQAAKQFVFNCWQEWQDAPDEYKSKADFARKMLKDEQCKSLTSQKKIEDWCREWEKANPAG